MKLWFQWDSIYCSLNGTLRIVLLSDDVPEKSNDEPVDDLNPRHKAESEAETAQSTDAGDEVKHCGSGRSRVFWTFIM